MKRESFLLLAIAILALIAAPFTHAQSLWLLAVPVIGMASIPNNALSDIIRQLAAAGALDPCGGAVRRVIAKTADYTILDPYAASSSVGGDAGGTIFTNRGATGTVIFTLPAPAQRLAGCVYEFLGIADYTITVKTATADTMILLNDITADSLSQQTSSALIGAHMRVICDGTSWVGYGDAVGVTYTVAT